MFRLPLNASNPYSSRRSISSATSASDDATDAKGLEEKFNLDEELFRLRESTKAALQQSWDEVESLQQQCADHLQFTSQLEAQLIEVHEKEETWRLRCLTAEKKLESSQQTTKLKPFRDTMRSWTNGRSVGLDAVPSSQSEPNLPGAKTLISDESAQPEIDGKIEQLSLKLSSRDIAIEGLEQTVEQHVKSMQNIQAEMLCLMETQRIKEKNITESHRRKEERLEKVVEFHRKKLVVKEACVEEHQRKLSDYRIYIEELTGELSKVLQVGQDVETRAGSSDCDTSHSRSKTRKGTINNSLSESVPLTVDLPSNEIFVNSKSLSDTDL